MRGDRARRVRTAPGASLGRGYLLPIFSFRHHRHHAVDTVDGHASARTIQRWTIAAPPWTGDAEVATRRCTERGRRTTSAQAGSWLRRCGPRRQATYRASAGEICPQRRPVVHGFGPVVHIRALPELFVPARIARRLAAAR